MHKILDSNGLTEEEFLKNYNASRFERPSVTNDILIFTAENKKEDNPRKVPEKGLQLLLIQRREHPDVEKWAVPGGFIHMDENLKDGACRELEEETGIDNVYVEQLYTFGDVGRDRRTRVISVANIALIPKESVKPKAGDDANAVQWFWVNKKLISKHIFEREIIRIHELQLISEDETIKIAYEIKETIKRNMLREKTEEYTLLSESTDSLAFDHCKMIDWAIERLRNKAEYTPIVFNLLPKLFTVKELQNLYEAILGREILNFKRKMGDMIVETEEREEGVPHKPAQYYRFNENWEHEF
jgi:ADP-ribose pyrophosphatase YjhB (NUDIX family)